MYLTRHSETDYNLFIFVSVMTVRCVRAVRVIGKVGIYFMFSSLYGFVLQLNQERTSLFSVGFCLK